MMPDWFIAWAETVNLWGVLLIIGAIVTTITGLVLFFRKGWPWLKTFAKAVINTAQIIDSVKELPAFIERTDATLAEQNATLAVQDERIAEIHHETHTNNGSSIKDAVIRTEEVLNTQVLPELVRLADTGAELRAEFEDTQPQDPKETP